MLCMNIVMHRTTISMDDEDYNFSEVAGINISQIVRSHIKELRDYADKDLRQVKELEARVQKFAYQSGMMRNFLEEKGLLDEFMKWRAQQNEVAS